MRKKNLLSIFILNAITYLIAGSDNNQIGELQNKMNEISVITAAGNLGAKTAADRPKINDRGWNLSADVLYWQTKIQNLCHSSHVSGIVDSPINYTQIRNNLSFDWAWGFKIGAGYRFEHDDFDSRAEYTYFRNHASVHLGPFSGSSGITSPLIDYNYGISYDSWTQFSANHVGFVYALELRESLKNSYNDVYWDLGRAFFVSKSLSLRPSLGVEATWFSFKGSAQFSNGISTDFDFSANQNVNGTLWGGLGNGVLKKISSTKSVGVGPRLGLDTNYYLCNGFSIYGNGSGALLFSYFKQNNKTTYSLKPNNQKIVINNFHCVTPTAKVDIGLRYNSNVFCDTQKIGISLGYESIYYWDVFGYSTVKGFGGLGMYGVNLKLRWDF